MVACDRQITSEGIDRAAFGRSVWIGEHFDGRRAAAVGIFIDRACIVVGDIDVLCRVRAGA